MSVLQTQSAKVGSRSSKLQSSPGVFAMIEELESRLMLSASAMLAPIGIAGQQPGMKPAASAAPDGMTPAQIRTAYGIDIVKFGSVVGDGTGMTIAIIDAYDDPNAFADLQTFDTAFGLPDPVFAKISQTGSTTVFPPVDTTPGSMAIGETSLDVQWAHAVAPKAKILLIEANSMFFSDLFAAIDQARTYKGGLGPVSVVSMSFGGTEVAGEAAAFNSHFTTPAGHIGITFIAAAGDTNEQVSYPAVCPTVLAVGGTALTVDSSNHWVSETGWGFDTFTGGGSGGGTSSFTLQPLYQASVVPASMSTIAGVKMRTVPDVAMDASPDRAVAVADSFDNGASTPWFDGGMYGTSLSAPLWSGVIAIINQGRATRHTSTLDGATQTLPMLYALPTSNFFHDITVGNNGNPCLPGYDLVTGRGTPIVNFLAPVMAGFPAPIPSIGSFSASPSRITSGLAITLTAGTVSTSQGTIITSVKFYQESNGVAGFQSSDTLIGAGTLGGAGRYTLATTAPLLPGLYTLYAVATNNLGFTSPARSIAVTVSLPFTTSGMSRVFGTYWWNTPGCGLFRSNHF